MSDAPGSLRDGRYAVTRALGEGSQGATFEAVDKKDGRLVAIKRFRVRGAKSWKEVELAEREARVLASIAHPALPRYVEHFEEGGELFLVTEKIEGESLAELRKKGALGEVDVVRFLRDASAALDYLHGRAPPVIHRDIKPSNVLRRPDGSFALIDFGAVRDRMKPEGGSTVVGTFGFMAPEQFQGRAMPASDVYAVGATAICLLTGREPEDLPHKGLAIDVDAALRGARVSPALSRALIAMLEPDPDRRASRIAPLLEGLDRGARVEPKREPRREREERRREVHEERRDARRAQRELERELRRVEREARHAARRALHEQRRDRGWRGVPPPILLLLMIGLTVGQVAVTIALRVVLPVLFSLASIVFGKSWREAAKSISNAGKTAVEAMSRARDAMSGRAPAPADDRARIAEEEVPAKVRFDEEARRDEFDEEFEEPEEPGERREERRRS